ncbi:site-specific integrase [Streptomyces exfoliatus]|uniref:site-specific integrase n=1 Tax=Streptomyces exfoliatus TaxID=1905 RepID=UPI003C2F7174
MRRRAEEIEEITVAGSALPTLGQAAHDFLSRDALDAATRHSYGQTLRRLCLALGEQMPLADVTADQVSQIFATAWEGTAARTWNRHRSAVRSFSTWASLNDLAARLDRRTETRANGRCGASCTSRQPE